MTNNGDIFLSFDSCNRKEVVLTKGKWKLEAWGSRATQGSCGGYASGVLFVKNKLTIYIHIGSSTNDGSCNGGGKGTHASQSINGGGATDMRAFGDTLYHRFLVAGGAGASGINAAGGGLDGIGTKIEGRGNPGLYNGPGKGCYLSDSVCHDGSFGYGGNGTENGCGGGGGGWYGGSSGSELNADSYRSGAGGSGYALNKTSYRPNGYQLNETYQVFLTKVKLIDGSQSMPSPLNKGEMITGNNDNGYAKITLLSTINSCKCRYSHDNIVLVIIIIIVNTRDNK